MKLPGYSDKVTFNMDLEAVRHLRKTDREREVVLILWRTELALNINEINKYAYKINERIQT